MNRRDFFRGLLATTAIIPTVSTKTIVDMAANTWRPEPATIGFKGAHPVPGEFYRLAPGLSVINPYVLWAAMRSTERSRKLEAP